MAKADFDPSSLQSEPEPIKNSTNSSFIKDNQNKYRVNRKVIINTCDISRQYQKNNNTEKDYHTGKNLS